MSNPAPSSRPAAGSPARRIRVVAGLAMGILWSVAILSRLFATGPTDSASACHRAVYRDPVSGRAQAIGTAHIAPGGAVTCHGVTYQAERR